MRRVLRDLDVQQQRFFLCINLDAVPKNLTPRRFIFIWLDIENLQTFHLTWSWNKREEVFLFPRLRFAAVAVVVA